ncbi:iron-sulfur cluster assembly scaffold protein SufA [Salmonella enterica subsp. enterica serovar Give]|nr:iron-sulfur cluster assembly scaffold protein SufA [Salmonella enterica subsp. enterica serovar Give]EAN3286226.1 iron-sulfur cluster assembly scaffold protein SufA [Salmonella enterica subsp. enterica serovar Give]EAN3323388.1 iron-sulfur cluster assembly scaffold protein SufA [Salmonella enterica subsp. enterica serovar Give]
MMYAVIIRCMNLTLLEVASMGSVAIDIVTALNAKLAPVPAASAIPFTPPMRGYEHRIIHHLSFDLADGQMFIPLSEATSYIQSITHHMRGLLAEAIQEWEARGSKGPLFSDERQMRRTLEAGFSESERVMKAIKIVMDEDNLLKMHPNRKDREEYKAKLIKFGRAVANNDYTSRDILSTMNQCVSPKRTCNPKQPPATAVKAMIEDEHKKLGITAPEWR